MKRVNFSVLQLRENLFQILLFVGLNEKTNDEQSIAFQYAPQRRAKFSMTRVTGKIENSVADHDVKSAFCKRQMQPVAGLRLAPAIVAARPDHVNHSLRTFHGK